MREFIVLLYFLEALWRIENMYAMYLLTLFEEIFVTDII
jgi:hypothetical protein